MKKLKSKHKTIIALLSICLLTGAVGITYARYQATTEKVENTFSVGNVTTEITEEVGVDGRNITKKPIVTNTGKNDAYIRMRVTISPEKDAVTIDDFNTAKWTYNRADGFYYYKEKVAPTKQTEAIFTKATLAKGFTGDVEITCYQEAVQTEARVDGKIVTNMMKIWEAYDTRTGVFAK